MKTKVPIVAAAIAAMMLTVSSCSEDHETLTPTGPSAISGPAAGPATSRTTANPTAGAAGVQINDETPRPGDSLPNPGASRMSSYTYIDGVPGSPRNVRVRPTGESLGISGYRVEVTWDPPSWGASNISGILLEVHDGQSVLSSNRSVGTIISPFTGFMAPAEGQFRMSLCNDVGCGPPYGAGSIVIGDAMHKPGPPAMTIAPNTTQPGEELISGRDFQATPHQFRLNWEKTDFVREIQIQYWLRPGKNWRTFGYLNEVQANTSTHPGVVWLMEGSWTVTARLRNSRGWGPRAVKRLNVRVDTNTTKPGTIPQVAWSNGRLRWQAPADTGGLPILKYQYFRTAGCTGTGTPYPLQRGDRYQLTSQEIRIRESPDGMSVRAHNRKGAGECTSTP